MIVMLCSLCKIYIIGKSLKYICIYLLVRLFC